MKNQPGKLGIREYTAIAIFVIGSRLTDDTVALIYDRLQKCIMDAPYRIRWNLFYSTLFIVQNIDLL